MTDAMIEHGINTTEADYWIHFHPIHKRVFWYRVEHCRQFIFLKNPPITIGRSKDTQRTATGAGYLIPKNTYFVSSADVPAEYVGHVHWNNLTDREAGFLGEHIIDVLVEKRVVTFPPIRVHANRDRASQFTSVDSTIRYLGTFKIESKTERVQSENLFVQSGERGHKVHSVKTESTVTERFSPAPRFTE